MRVIRHHHADSPRPSGDQAPSLIEIPARPATLAAPRCHRVYVLACREYFGSVWEHLRSREVVGLLEASLLTIVILFGPQLAFLPILMNERFDAPSYVMGTILSGAPLTSAATSSQLTRLAEHFSELTLLKSA